MKYKTRERIKGIIVFVIFAGALVCAAIIVTKTGKGASKQGFSTGLSNAILCESQLRTISIMSDDSKYNNLSFMYMNKNDRQQLVVNEGGNELYRVIIDSEFNVYLRLDCIYKKYVAETDKSDREKERMLKRVGLDNTYSKAYVMIEKDEFRELLEANNLSAKLMCNIFPNMSNLFNYERTEAEIEKYGEVGIFKTFIRGCKEYVEDSISTAFADKKLSLKDNAVVFYTNGKIESIDAFNGLMESVKMVDNNIGSYKAHRSIKNNLEQLCDLLNDCGMSAEAEKLNSEINRIENENAITYGLDYILNMLVTKYMSDKEIEENNEQTKISSILESNDDTKFVISSEAYDNGSANLIINAKVKNGDSDYVDNYIKIENRVSTNSIIVIPSKEECIVGSGVSIKNVLEKWLSGQDFYEIVKDIAVDTLKK